MITKPKKNTEDDIVSEDGLSQVDMLRRTIAMAISIGLLVFLFLKIVFF